MLLVLAAEGVLGRSCSLHACTVVMLLSQLLLRARRLGKMICSLTQCGPLFWVVYSSPFFLFLLVSSCSAVAALLHWQGKNHWRLRCAAGPEAELKVLPDFSKRTCVCAWAEAMLELTLQ